MSQLTLFQITIPTCGPRNPFIDDSAVAACDDDDDDDDDEEEEEERNSFTRLRLDFLNRPQATH
eukprot:6757213-Prymnesium_polylepis.1